MDDQEDVSPFSRRIVATESAGSKSSEPFGRLGGTPSQVSPFTQVSNTAPNVNPFTNASQEPNAGLPVKNLFAPIFGAPTKPNPFTKPSQEPNAGLPVKNRFAPIFGAPTKPLFSGFAGASKPISSSTGFLAPSQVTSGTQEKKTPFAGSTNVNQTNKEPSIFDRTSPSKKIFIRSLIGEDSAGIGISNTQARQEADKSGIDPETGGPLVTGDGNTKSNALFTGRKIDLKKQPKPSQTRSGKDEASIRPRGRQDLPSSKRGRRGDANVVAKTTVESRKITKADDTFGDPASVDITELEKFGGSRQSKSAGSSPRKRSEMRHGGIFGVALKATGLETEKKKEKQIQKEPQKDIPRRQVPRQVSKSPDIPRRQVTRQVSKSPDDGKTNISVWKIPNHLNNKYFLRRHFKKFGSILYLHPQPRKRCATITYTNHDDAVKAKTHGRHLERGAEPVSIILTDRRPTRRPTVTDEDGKEVTKKRTVGSEVKPVSPRPPASQETTTDKPATVASEPSMVKQATYSATERYQVLVENDKLLRQAKGNKKQEDLSTASTVKGTCCDMCPEKERYMREVQRRVHVFEMVPGTDKNPQITHAIAVKEYSRSSADQEAPLPHELRPPSVLNMTMNYLMVAIMDKGEGRWADWFDFVWNRTRGIRKDITQQHLCNLTAVHLVEKCARFHIYCAHRLCEAGTRAFDPKINNENLTKCLQSLKQFYADLDEEGTICPNEAEFRGYNVLLNLNQGDILREVQKFRFEVRESSQVKFAVQVFTALNSNNYVRFFKLVKSATYLNACVLHRYFTQIRSTALKTMVRAYSTARGGSYPLVDFVRQLSFEDESEASEFCACHGLEVTDGDIIFGSKSSFVRPSNAIGATRALKLIDAKNQLSIGQVVNNQYPLPPLESHIPMTSFDSEGKFLGQNKMIAAITIETPSAEDSQSTEEKEDTKAPEYTPEQINKAAKSLFLEVINEMCEELSRGLLTVLHLMKNQAPLILEDVLQEVTVPMIYDAITVAYEEEVERLAQEKKRLQEEAQRRERQRIEEEKERARIASLKEVIANEICNEIVNRTTAEESLCIAVAQDIEVKIQLERASIRRTTFTLHLDILEETLQEELRRISSDVYAAAIEARRLRLAEIQRCVELIRTGRYFKKWKDMHAARIRLKRAMYEFPSAPASTSLKGQIEMLLPFRSSVSPILEGNTMLVGKKAKMSLETPVSVLDGRTILAHTILQHHYLAYHQHQRAWAAFELPTILGQSLSQSDASIPNHHSSHIYWKLVVSVPDFFDDGQQTSGDAEILCDWLEAKFTKGKINDHFKNNVLMDNDMVNTVSLYTCPINHHGYNKQELSVCVKFVSGQLGRSAVEESERCHQFLGTSAMILALERPDDAEDQYYWLSAQLRLKNILQAKPLLPAIPLVVCLLGWSCSLSVCSEMLDLQELVCKGLLSAYKIQPIQADILEPQASESLSEGVDWLALHQPKPPSLKQLPLRAFVDNGLMLFFTTCLYEDVKDRNRAGIPDQNPEYIVELYNSVICHLCQVATSPHLASISWPVAEFSIKNHESIDGAHLDWNSDSQMLRLKSRISSLQLPDPPDTSLLDDWHSACSACVQYVTMITADSRSMTPLITRVKRLLERREREFENTCYLSFDQSGCVPTVDHIPWVKILEMCISHKLAMLQEAMQHQEDWDPDSQLFLVYYLESDLDNYKPPSVWKEATKETAEDTRFYPDSICKSFYTSANKKRAETNQLDETDGTGHRLIKVVPEPIPMVKETSIKVIPEPIPMVKETSETVEDFKLQMMKEREEMKRLDKLLAECTEDEYIPNQGMMTECSPTLQLYVPKDSGIMTCFPTLELTIEDKLQELGESIKRDRRANRLADLKMHSFLDG